MMNQFVLRSKLDNRASIYEEEKDYLTTIDKNSGLFEIKNSNNNSKLSDYGTTFYDKKIVFASTRDSIGAFVKKHSWNNQPFSNFYISEIKDDGSLSNPKYFSKELNSTFHESTPVFTKDLKTIYFTRNKLSKNNNNKNNSKNYILSLYKAENVNGKWTNIQELPFCGDNFMTAHPSLSNDEKILYFSSNRENPIANADIYKVDILLNGKYGTPINLGNIINTNSRETFPFISKDNFLYFASDGHPGLGGLDIFVSKINEDGSFQKPINLGKPINSEQDDFALILDSDSKIGFISSNRKVDNYGDDDIYYIKQIKDLPKIEEKVNQLMCENSINGKIISKNNNLPISQAKILLLNQDKIKVSEITTDTNGNFIFKNVKCDSNYYLNVSKNEFFTTEEIVKTKPENASIEKNIILDNQITKIEKGVDLAKSLNIEMIYFDLDKYYIRKDAAIELSKILIFLKDNPSVNIEIRSHTDSRNTDSYNQILSSNRAKSTLDWLVKNGINRNRLKARGYGESQLTNNCADGINCTEEEHQLNRRSEFIILNL